MSSFAAGPSSAAFVAAPPPRSPQRKSPPPPPLNLDDCRPKPLPAPLVYRPASSPTSPGGGSTSFVFTSSRTKHTPLAPPFALSSASSSTHAISPPPPPPVRRRRSRSPTASASTTSGGTVRSHRAPAALSATQLARHREGAMDSRRILGPNMRAAGFVHLASSVGSLNGSSATPSPASSPDWQEIPGPSNYMGTASVQLTPTDPPPFPPIVFVPPSAVQKLSMWEYQKWPHGQKPSPTSPLAAHPSVPTGMNTFQGRSMSEGDAAAAVGLGVPSTSRSSLSPPLFSSSDSTAISAAPSIVPSRSMSLSTTSFASSPEARRALEKGKDRERDASEMLAEYPFPRTPSSLSSRTPDSSRVASAHSSRDDSPELSSNAARNARSTKPKIRAKDKDREKRTDDRIAGLLAERTQERVNVSAHVVQHHARAAEDTHALSFAELYEPGFAWTMTNMDMFMPALGSRRRGGTPSPPEQDIELGKEEEEEEAPMEVKEALAAVTVVEAAAEAERAPEEIQRAVEVEKVKERHHYEQREQRQAEKKHIAGLVAAHRERDEDHVRYVAAEREKEEKKGKEKEKQREEKKGKDRDRGSRRSSPVAEERGRTSPKRSGRTSPKEKEHRERDKDRTSPGHKERKSRRHSPKFAVHKAKSIMSDATGMSDAETIVGDAGANAAGDVLAA